MPTLPFCKRRGLQLVLTWFPPVVDHQWTIWVVLFDLNLEVIPVSYLNFSLNLSFVRIGPSPRCPIFPMMLKKGRNSGSWFGIDDVVFIFTHSPKNQASPSVGIYTYFGLNCVISPIRFAKESMSGFLSSWNFCVGTFLNFPASVSCFPVISACLESSKAKTHSPARAIRLSVKRLKNTRL